ncbi:tachylectin-related carbohydrate-binding protein [Streptomyces sp. NPDC051098]|uniref:tachylectin-related carbohydrate-binding protein n=1 Tax=Streptomyces sp. NPDC051098 TaxID=3155411 RepID=UPI003426C641
MRRVSTYRPRRRTAIVTAAAALPLLVAIPGSAHAADAAACTANGSTYAVNSTGSLLQYKLKSPLDGVGGYLNPATIGSSWHNYPLVLSGPGGKFYLLRADGTYYGRRDASGAWPVSVRKITSAFGWLADAADRNQVTIDRAGRMWVLLENGDLHAYQYDGSGGAWNPAGTTYVHDQGWNRYNLITAADDGVIYGRSATDGKLYRSRYDGASQRWIERHVLVSSSDWRQFKSLTSNGGDTLLAVKTTGEALYYRFDENTRTWPVSRAQVGSSGWQNLLSVSAAPDNCRILANHTPPAPALAQESYSRGSVMQSSAGSLEFAYTDNIGRLVHGRMADASDTSSVQWTTVSGNEAFTGTPSLAEQADGRIVVTGHNISGATSQLNQVAKSSADWAPWINLAGAMTQHAVTAKTPSGLLAQFAADAGGRPWYRVQTAVNGDLKGWMPLAGSGFAGSFTTVTVRDGIQLFGRNASGVLSTALFRADGTLTAWSPLGTRAVTGTPAAVVYPGYRIRLFATDVDGKVVTAGQPTEDGAYGEWSQVGDLTVKGSPSAVISPLTGLTEIVARGADDNFIHNTGETTQASGVWRTWKQESFEASATEPTALTYTNSNGPAWAYSFRTSDNQTRLYAAQQTSAFSARSLPTPPAG